MKDLAHLILRPLVTEKLEGLREGKNQYAFEVRADLNKIEIARGIELRFEVKVKSVRTQRIGGKQKRMGRHSGFRRDWKKAIVTLKPGHKIELFEGV